jgi:hypothetical protein
MDGSSGTKRAQGLPLCRDECQAEVIQLKKFPSMADTVIFYSVRRLLDSIGDKIEEGRLKFQQMLSAPKLEFDDTLRSKIPIQHGLYIISSPDSSILRSGEQHGRPTRQSSVSACPRPHLSLGSRSRTEGGQTAMVSISSLTTRIVSWSLATKGYSPFSNLATRRSIL